MEEGKTKVKKTGDGKLVSFIGLGLMLIAFVLAVAVTNSAGSDYFAENTVTLSL